MRRVDRAESGGHRLEEEGEVSGTGDGEGSIEDDGSKMQEEVRKRDEVFEEG